MCVRVQVTLPYKSSGLFNVLYTLILLFQLICLDLNTVCRERTIQKIHRKSSSWFSHYTVWAIAALNIQCRGDLKSLLGHGRGEAGHCSRCEAWITSRNKTASPYSLAALNEIRNMLVSVLQLEKQGGLKWMEMRQDSARKRVNKTLI